jgi:hypothetical protein
MTTRVKLDRDHQPIKCLFRGKNHVGHYYLEDGKVTVWCQFGSDSAAVHEDNAQELALTMFDELLTKAHFAGRL